MITDLGYVSILLALVVAVYAAVAAPLGAREGFPELVRSARRAVYAAAALVTLAIGVLLQALIGNDFGLRYAWQYTSLDMALPYRISAVYAGNDGSLVFWVWILVLLSAGVVFLNRRERVLSPYVIATTMAIAAFFLVLISLVANPFERLPMAQADGRGMNPMLENPGMLIHPPTLYLGYVGLAIPFAFVVAALVSGRLSGDWLCRTRGWALFAWLLLGIGNVLGAQWAYVELGWGGYWAWDPVENASLMPWLLITAYLHAGVILRRRQMFQVWIAGLAAAAFLFSIFGTFVTRSGIISSVHAYGQSALGPFFLAFLGAGIVLSVALIVWRRDLLRGADEIESFMSRENWVMITNIILIGVTAAVLLGTTYPVLSELFTGRKVELGPDFYNQVNGPILLGLLAVMGVCPILAWRHSSRETIVSGLAIPAVAALVVGGAIFAAGARNLIAVVGFVICFFVIFSHLGEWYRGTRARQRSRGVNPVSAFAGMFWSNRPRYGAHVSHLAMAIMAIGVIGSSFFVSEAEGNLKVGETMNVGAYTVRYEGLSQDSTPSRDIISGTVTLLQGEATIGQMTAENYFHKSFEQPVSEVAIYTTPLEDVYLILAGWTADGTATFKVLINPLVVWIWVGGGLLLLGGVVAMWPEARPQVESVPQERRRPATRPA